MMELRNETRDFFSALVPTYFDLAGQLQQRAGILRLPPARNSEHLLGDCDNRAERDHFQRQ
jgi:hypothetical protein